MSREKSDNEVWKKRVDSTLDAYLTLEEELAAGLDIIEGLVENPTSAVELNLAIEYLSRHGREAPMPEEASS